MALTGRIRILILSASIVVLGIVHLGVSIGIIAKYRQFGDVFQQQVGLCGYNLVIAIFAITVGIISIVAIIKNYTFIMKIMVIAVLVLGVFTLASLIAALACSGTAATHLRNSLTNNMNSYISNQRSIDIIDNIQTTYQCCGVNLWLDWSRVSLGTGGGINIGGRRRSLPSPPSPLVRTLKRRQNANTIWNLPSSYTVNLPLSCCVNGGTTNGNSLGGYCVFSSANTTSTFFVGGCLEPVSNRAFSQIAGIIVINTCLTILSFVYFGTLLTIFRREKKVNEVYSKNGTESTVYQESFQPPQYQADPYYTNNYNPDPQYNYNPSLQYSYNPSSQYNNNPNPQYNYSNPNNGLYL